jgi:hypothetical protein
VQLAEVPDFCARENSKVPISGGREEVLDDLRRDKFFVCKGFPVKQIQQNGVNLIKESEQRVAPRETYFPASCTKREHVEAEQLGQHMQRMNQLVHVRTHPWLLDN